MADSKLGRQKREDGGTQMTLHCQTNTVNAPVNAQEIFDALATFIKQRPGLDPANYGCAPGQTPDFKQRMEAWRSYRSELRSISRDRQRALAALDEARGLTPAQPDLLLDSFRAFSGRLSWVTDAVVKQGRGTVENPYVPATMETTGSKGHLEYTAGQYFPTEYRRAAAAVLEAYVSAWARWWSEQHPQTFTYRTMDDVIAANKSVGGHWFDRDTMRFFKTRIESGAVALHTEDCHKARFITSEKGPDGVRKYSIREAQPDGSIDTVGEFQQYRTRDAARAALLK
jgi:hypothetical protein